MQKGGLSLYYTKTIVYIFACIPWAKRPTSRCSILRVEDHFNFSRMTWIDFFSTIGGLLGLVLGMDIITLVELVWLAMRLISHKLNFTQWIRWNLERYVTDLTLGFGCFFYFPFWLFFNFIISCLSLPCPPVCKPEALGQMIGIRAKVVQKGR